MRKVTCPLCHYEGAETKTYTKGSTLVELALWCCFLVPGLIYSMWRLGSRYKGCPKCKFENVIIEKI